VQKKFRLAAILCGVLLLVAVGGLSTLYWASQQVPTFYEEIVAADPVGQRRASDEMLQRSTTLANDLRREGRWEMLVTAEQINGWLAVDLVENHPEALPETFRDPRVAVGPDTLTVACRYRQGATTSVLTLTLEPYLSETNCLSIRIRKARAGLLPVPLAGLLDRVAEAAHEVDLPLKWHDEEGDPVATIPLTPPDNEDDRRVQIDTLKLSDGKIYIAGTTSRRNR